MANSTNESHVVLVRSFCYCRYNRIEVSIFLDMYLYDLYRILNLINILANKRGVHILVKYYWNSTNVSGSF